MSKVKQAEVAVAEEQAKRSQERREFIDAAATLAFAQLLAATYKDEIPEDKTLGMHRAILATEAYAGAEQLYIVREHRRADWLPEVAPEFDSEALDVVDAATEDE